MSNQLLKVVHYSFACPMRALDDKTYYTEIFSGVTCQVCRALYGKHYMDRLRARRKLSIVESAIVKKRSAEIERSLTSLKERNRTPWRARALAILAPLLACLLCPAHIAMILAFLGFGVTVHGHSHGERWIYLGFGLLISVGILLLERWHHRRHCHH